MKELKRVTMFIILLLSINFGHSQLDYYENDVKINSQKQVLKTNNSDSIVHSIPSPAGSANGITFDGNSLWVASTGYTLYMISPTDGSIQKTIGIEIGYATGITFIEPDLYVVDRIDKRICKIDTVSGNVIDFFYTPEDNINGFPSGLTWDGNNLWYNCGGEVDTIYELNLSGQVLSQHKIIGDVPSGLTFDGSNLWSINTDSDVIYQISLPDFILIDSINAPGPISSGLAFDGEFLWVSENSEGLIYQIDVGDISSISFNELVHATLNVWPNPTSDFINVEIPTETKTVNFKIYCMDGQIAKSFQINENKQSDYYQLNLSDLKSGIYFLTTNLNDRSLSRKIIIK